MSIHVFALLTGIVAGLRAVTPLAAVSWAAHIGWLHLENTWLAFLGFAYTPYILSLFALGELIADKLPRTPSRKTLMPFIARVVSGALCGAALGASRDHFTGGLIAGALGAVIGTLGGYQLRVRLAAAAGGRGLLIALLEDLIAISGAISIIVFATAPERADSPMTHEVPIEHPAIRPFKGSTIAAAAAPTVFFSRIPPVTTPSG